VRKPDFGASFERVESREWVQASCVLKRSVLLSTRLVSTVMLIGLRGGHHAFPGSDSVSYRMTAEFILASARVFDSDPGLVKDGL